MPPERNSEHSEQKGDLPLQAQQFSTMVSTESDIHDRLLERMRRRRKQHHKSDSDDGSSAGDMWATISEDVSGAEEAQSGAMALESVAKANTETIRRADEVLRTSDAMLTSQENEEATRINEENEEATVLGKAISGLWSRLTVAVTVQPAKPLDAAKIEQDPEIEPGEMWSPIDDGDLQD
eukprot:gnl/TRDRNA2_/TRDRNA2_145033_c0_seq1.p1 gnl/TRDRNA2_/TRDRNA2_145033_c0~~gnl/TRDRNA2_/TRDRNA2_145033_c0_seq1.p1  ORF type:complete len:198 (-),score=55.41 gnl/TRDRNA2_/TRDRNA2_145033_c0_seq1:225-764(-)